MVSINIHAEASPRDLPQPPRLAGYPVIGLLPQVRKDPLGFFVETACRYGEAVQLEFGFNKVLMLNRPEYIRHVFQDNHENYTKSKFYGPLKPILGEGIFLSEGEAWLRQRRSAAKGFQGVEIRKMHEKMIDAADDMLGRWDVARRSGAPLDMVREMMRVTLDIVLRCLLSVRLDNEHADVFQALTVLLRDAERRVWALYNEPAWVPTPRRRKCRRALAVLDGFAKRIIEERLASQRSHADLLQVLVDAHRAGELPRERLRDQVLSFILAGHETTANSLSWTCYLLSRHPECARRVKREAADLLHGRPPSFEQVAELSYARMVFDEALRLYPPVWTLSRTPREDDRIGDIEIPKGMPVQLCAFAVHRRPELWPNPEGFDPERFGKARAGAIPRYAYFPFGGGPRVCLGARFATIEAMVLLSMVLQRYDLELVPGVKVEPEPMITLRPRDALLMRLREAA